MAKHILDNEASEDYLQAIERSGIKYEKVLLNIHWRNMAEKAISMFKDHFQAIMVGVDSTFPMHLWDRLLHQVGSMLNMMQPMNIAPTNISICVYEWATQF